ALMEYKRAVNANKRVPNSVSEDEVWQKRFEWYRGMKSEDKAKYDLEIAALAVDVKEAAIAIADADLEERLIRAPLSGQVDDIFKNKGEWLREGDNVLHVLRLDKINITANFDSEQVSPAMIQGKAVTVYATKAGVAEPQKMEGVITYARPVLMMNRFVAYAAVNNVKVGDSWVLIPGMRVNLIVHKDKAVDPATFGKPQE
ncbi:MAG: HlyD family efflux transporter periplasmic adaptor subunit, partial [Thermoguttaceae bacterium]|nr:HlyD family efflux transporter periplasmic adaptor subunit [Thermoguttaceae bacterium]